MNSQQHPGSFATLLRRGRREVGITQEELAERAGVAWRTISDLERGVKHPRRDTAALLAEALALTGEQRAAFEAARRLPVPRGAGAAPTGSASGWSHRASPPTALVGRAHELAALDRHLAGAGPSVLLLAGQPGIGKSRLLQAAAARASLLGLTVLAGGCTRSGAQHSSPSPRCCRRCRAASPGGRRARVGTCPFGLIHALRVAALVATEQGRWDEAERALEEGLALARGPPYPHSEGRLLHAYGRLHARKDEPARARARLDAALAIFARLGARTDSERAERDLAGLQS